MIEVVTTVVIILVSLLAYLVILFIKNPIKHTKTFIGKFQKGSRNQVEATNTVADPYKNIEAFIELGRLISNNNQSVVHSLTLYTQDPKTYFSQRSNKDFQLESQSEIYPELPLIESLFYAGKIVYVDHKTEAHSVLTMLDVLVNRELSKHSDFRKFYERYRSHGRTNTIGNFLDIPKMKPKPFKLTKKCGYSLLQLDEGSDSYPLFLAKPNDVPRILDLAGKVGYKVKNYNK